VKATDDKTLVVTLEAPCSFFIDLCGFPTFLPVRQDIIEKHPTNWTQSASTYLSDGPYKLQSWTHNSQIVMAKNADYWNAKSITGPNTITWKLMSDPNAIFTAYKTGQLQYAEGVPSQEYDSLKASGDLQIYNWLGTYYIDMNNTKAPFNDPKVREAINLVIDRNYIVNSITKGGEVPADNFVPPGIKDPDGTDFHSQAKSAYSVAAADYDANVTQAQQLLSQAGYKVPGNTTGKDFPTFDYLTNDAGAHVAIATYLQQTLKDKLGITMNVQKMDWNTFLAARQQGNYVVARDGWIADYADPMTFLSMFKTGDGNNNAKYSNPQFDALIDAANKETDATKRFADMQQAQQILMNTDYGIAPIYYYTQPAAVSPKLQGIYNTPTGFTYFFWTTSK
jgi:oligopeptide transport system substrate-binding protein